MPSDRERRLALNEAAFRVANERMQQWPERRGDEEPARFYCECAATGCHEQILVPQREYERVRADSNRFLIVPGHEVPDVERIVDRRDGYHVIEKTGEAREVTEATDPRG